MDDRRRQPTPTTPAGCLDHISGGILLDRLPVPMLGVTADGEIAYANQALATMLGHCHAREVIRRPLPTLLAGRSGVSPSGCVSLMRTAGSSRVDWNHVDGYRVPTIISPPVLLRADDPLLLVGITDVSVECWTNGR